MKKKYYVFLLLPVFFLFGCVHLNPKLKMMNQRVFREHPDIPEKIREGLLADKIVCYYNKNENVFCQTWLSKYTDDVDAYNRKVFLDFFEKDKTPPEIIENIRFHRVSIGMTKAQVILSWGDPKNINKTITASRTSEQWVYHNYQYLYFENGILRAIQN